MRLQLPTLLHGLNDAETKSGKEVLDHPSLKRDAGSASTLWRCPHDTKCPQPNLKLILLLFMPNIYFNFPRMPLLSIHMGFSHASGLKS